MIRTDYTKMERLRSYSSIFSRSVFSDIIEYDDYTRLNTILNRYDSKKEHFSTYFDYIKYIVYVQVLIVYYIASVNLQYYSNKGNPTLP